MRKNIFVLMSGCLLLLCSSLYSQDMEELLSKYTSVNGEGYMQPLATVFGANLNSGFFRGADIPLENKFHLSVGFEVMNSWVGDKHKTFTAQTEDPFLPAATKEVPTIFGDTQVDSVVGQGGTVFYFPGGFGVKMVPLVVPQLTIGALYGTEAVVRFFTWNLSEDLGKLTLFGIGARHSISQYFDKFPVDLAGGFFYQKFKIGDIVNANNIFFGVQSSKTWGIFTAYSGVSFESSSMKIDYTFDSGAEQEEIAFDLTGKNSIRWTLGFSLRLYILDLHVDYSLASQSVLTAGIAFGG